MMAKLFGANWRTTFTNFIALVFASATAIAAAPSELDVLPSALYEYRGRIIAICGVIAFLSRLLNGQFQKDKNITGGTTQQTVSGAVAKPGTQTLVDATVRATVQSDEQITPEQKKAIQQIP